MVNKKSKIGVTKGRSMLTWIGKKPLDYIKSFPAALEEFFVNGNDREPLVNPTYNELKINWQNLLFHGDNEEIMGYLLSSGFRGVVNLIYIDPPFDSGANYIRRVELRGDKERVDLEGEDYSLGEQIQYHDIWVNDAYLQFMYERLILMRELLDEKGSIFINVDEHKGHFLRLLMDEIFGPENFVNEIIWYYPDKFQGNVKGLANNHQSIYWYTKSGDYTANKIKIELDKPIKRDKRVWSKEAQKLVAAKDESGKTIYESFSEKKIDDVWLDDIWKIGQTSVSKSYSKEYTGYPTQKPEEMIRRIILLASEPDDIVFDSFVGSGTTAAVAESLGRRWIACDINRGAIQTTSKRLQEAVKSKHVEVVNKKQQKKISGQEETTNDYPFAIYKVNDYDLKVLKTEASELVIQQMGITRTKTDAFFEGTLGKNLIKIIDFNHPLTPLDLQLITDELKKRPDENRNVTVDCLGKELATDPWIEDYNKKHPVNKLEVVELRTDRKLGKMLIHKPDAASLEIKREGENVVIKIKNFISPTIVERLSIDARLVKPKITDFRSMIDVVLIDTNYNGKVFNVAYSDVPEKKDDFVEGAYKLPIRKSKSVVAVKIIDMLGEEIILTKEV